MFLLSSPLFIPLSAVMPKQKAELHIHSSSSMYWQSSQSYFCVSGPLYLKISGPVVKVCAKHGFRYSCHSMKVSMCPLTIPTL